MLQDQALAVAFSGKLQEARKFFKQSIELSQRRNFTEAAAATISVEAVVEATFGNTRKARERAHAALSLAPGRPLQAYTALALARSGALGRAERLADDLAQRFPTDTLLNARDLPTLRAAIEIQRNNPARAVELLQSATPYELGWFGMFNAMYTRGQAYVQAGQGTEAAAEYQKILDHRGVAPLSPQYPLAYLGLARAHALAGDTAGARRAYQDFLALWKDADPDIPILQEAKAEYAKLQ